MDMVKMKNLIHYSFFLLHGRIDLTWILFCSNDMKKKMLETANDFSFVTVVDVYGLA